MKVQKHIRRLLLVGAISIAGLSTSTLAAENLPALISTRQSAFAIPYTVPVPKSQAEQPTEVRLFVSSDAGKSWQPVDAAKIGQIKEPLRGQFVFQSKADGEYWFAIRTVDSAGQLRGGNAKPELRVLVDSQSPVFKLDAQRGAAGEISVRWDIADAALVSDTLTMSYQVAGKTDWRTIAIDKSRMTNNNRAIQGVASFWPETPGTELTLRAEARDRAGNVGTSQVVVAAAAGSVGTPANTAVASNNPIVNPATGGVTNSAAAVATNNNAAQNPVTQNLANPNPASQGNDPPPAFPFNSIAGSVGNNIASNAAPNTNVASPLAANPAAAANNTPAANNIANETAPRATNGMRLAPNDTGPALFGPQNNSSATTGIAAPPGINTAVNPTPGNSLSPNVVGPGNFIPPINNPANNLTTQPIGLPVNSALEQPKMPGLPVVNNPPANPNINIPNAGLAPTNTNSVLSNPAFGASNEALKPKASDLAPRVESQQPAAQLFTNLSPAIGSNTNIIGATNNTQKSLKDALAQFPAGKLPRMVNSKVFEWDYELESVGAAGIAQVELWMTRDNGGTWQSVGVDADNRSPVRTSVDGEGVYGYKIMVQSAGGAKPRPPQSGDQPEIMIGVDLTKPTAKLMNAELGTGNSSGEIAVTWNASDDLLASRPVTLQYSGEANGPWQTIAARVENTGRYAWRYDAQTPDKLFLRLEVRDEAGNVGVSQSIEPISLERTNPAGKLQQVRPVSEGTSSNSSSNAKPSGQTATKDSGLKKSAANHADSSDSHFAKTQMVENPFFKSQTPVQSDSARPGLYR